MLNNYKNKATATNTGTDSNAAMPRWRITIAVLGLLTLLTKHYALHRPEHVGMFAGSLLQRGDWDH